MDYPNTRPQATAARADLESAGRGSTHTALYQCLIVSPCHQRCERFKQEVADGGWESVVRQDAGAASADAERIRFQLAIVDLFKPEDSMPAGYCQLAEDLSKQTGLLLIVCGSDGDAMEEIWAHQIGTWLYLPGVDEQSDVAMVCGQARVIVEKLEPRGQPPDQVNGKRKDDWRIAETDVQGIRH